MSLPDLWENGIVRHMRVAIWAAWEAVFLSIPTEGSTHIGKSVSIRGEISGSEDLFLDGNLVGTILLPDSRVTIGPNAQVTADLKVRDLVVYGLVLGNAEASGRVELRQSAEFSGDIAASRLSIEETASMRGRISLTGGPSTAVAAGQPERP